MRHYMLFTLTCAGPPRHRRRSSWTSLTRRPSPETRRSGPGIQNSYFSVQFVPHCHNLSEQYWLQVGCAKFNLICTDVGGGGLFGTTKRFLQYCLPTPIVTLVYFCSQGYRNGDRCGHLVHLNIWSVEEHIPDPQS